MATNTFHKWERLDPGEPIKVKVGQDFALKMESNPTTGYSWQISKAIDENVVQFVTNAYIPPDSNLDGAGGNEVWMFRAVGEGPAEIFMNYVRQWETNQPAITNMFTVIVE